MDPAGQRGSFPDRQSGSLSSMIRHRIDQILSRHGYCSRGESRGWLKAGRVRIGDRIAGDPSEKVAISDLRIDGEPVDHPEGILVMLHKPAGLVCSHDEREGPNIYSLLPERWLRRNPPVTSVGRLDKDTTGLLLVTDQGPLVQRWTSPRHKVVKRYEATVDRDLDPDLVPLFASGTLRLPDDPEPCLPATLVLTGDRTASLELVEGRFHQVRRMFACRGFQVVSLHRSRFGRLELESLAAGEWTPIEAGAI
jgi:16S rRNA pseudouridine516 synthase